MTKMAQNKTVSTIPYTTIVWKYNRNGILLYFRNNIKYTFLKQLLIQFQKVVSTKIILYY